MRQVARILILMVASFAWAASAALSAQADSPERLVLQGAELGPFAYTHFCVRYPAECTVRDAVPPAGADLALTPERRAELLATNAAVNGAIAPAAHAGRGTFDTWTIAPARGDCNDYAVTKRHELLAQGWPSGALLLAEVVTSWGEHHLVLVARTSGGDLVLDNLSAKLRDWAQTDYVWLFAQMPTEPSLWARILPPAHPIADRSRMARADSRPAVTQ